MMQITYRPAQVKDKDNLAALLRLMHKEVGLSSLNEDKMFNRIDITIQSGVAFLAEYDGKIIGSMGVFIGDFWYSDDPVLMDSWLFVRKDFRKTRAAWTLLSKIKMFAKKAKAPLVVGVFSLGDTVRKNKLFSRYFKPAGEFFTDGF